MVNKTRIFLVVLLSYWVYNTMLPTINPKVLLPEGPPNPDREKPDPSQFPFYFQNKEGLWLHWASSSASAAFKGTLILCHGNGEHKAFYDGMAQWFNNKGYDVFRMDMQGMGLSEGNTYYAEDYHTGPVDDLEQFIKEIVIPKKKKDSKLFIFGQSYGAGITQTLGMRLENAKLVDGVVLAGSAYKLEMPAPLISFFKFLGDVIPKARLPVALPWEVLALNPQWVTKASNDPLATNFGFFNMRLLKNILDLMDHFEEKSKNFQWPVLMAHAEKDITPVEQVEHWMNNQISSTNKKLVTYGEGYAHHIHHEKKELREKVYQDMITFFDSLLSSSPEKKE